MPRPAKHLVTAEEFFWEKNQLRCPKGAMEALAARDVLAGGDVAGLSMCCGHSVPLEQELISAISRL